MDRSIEDYFVLMLADGLSKEASLNVTTIGILLEIQTESTRNVVISTNIAKQKLSARKFPM